jgi:hypothetical protein
MKGLLKEKLDHCIESGELIQLYFESDNMDTFDVGRLLFVDDEKLLFRQVNTSAKWDGYCLYGTDDLLFASFDTKYLKLLSSNLDGTREINLPKTYSEVIDYLIQNQVRACITDTYETSLDVKITDHDAECFIYELLSENQPGSEGIGVMYKEAVVSLEFLSLRLEFNEFRMPMMEDV